MQRIIGAAQFLFVKEPGQGIETGAADLFRHVRRIKARFYCLFLNILDELHAQMAGALHLGLMRVKLVFDEGSGGLDDHLLFV